MSAPLDHVATVRSYFNAIRDEPDAVAGFYSADVVQDELPTRFLPNGARHGLRSSERPRSGVAR